MPIDDLSNDIRFQNCGRAFFANCIAEMRDFNMELLHQNLTGNWTVADGRIGIGDLFCLAIPQHEHEIYPKEIFAGIVCDINVQDDGSRQYLCEEFFQVEHIEHDLEGYLNNRNIAQGNNVLGLWNENDPPHVN